MCHTNRLKFCQASSVINQSLQSLLFERSFQELFQAVLKKFRPSGISRQSATRWSLLQELEVRPKRQHTGSHRQQSQHDVNSKGKRAQRSAKEEKEASPRLQNLRATRPESSMEAYKKLSARIVVEN